MRVRIYNTFHGTEITVKVEERFRVHAIDNMYWRMLQYYGQEYGSKERAKVQRIKRALCGIKGCMCGGMVRCEIID